VKVHFTKAKMKNQYKVIDGMQCGMEMAIRKTSMVLMVEPSYET